MFSIRFAILSVCAVALSAGAAYSQIVVDKVQPGRLDDPNAGKGTTIKPEIQPAAPKTTIAPSQAMSGNITGVRLEKSTLPHEVAEAAMRPLIGKPINPENLKALADAYSAAYAKSDIALYTILVPEQTFESGQVRIVAIENYIDEVVLAGDNPESAALTRAYAQEMAKDRPLTKPVLRRYLLLMDDVPGATTTPNVIAGSRPDTVKLVLDTKRDPIETVVSVDTRGAAQLGRMQISGDVYLNGYGYEGNQTRLTASTSGDFNRFISVAASHAITLGPSGLTATASLGAFRTRPDNTPMEGKGYTGSLQLSYPVVRSINTNITAAGGLDGFNSDNALVGQILSSDRTRTLRGALSIENLRGKTAWGASVSVSHGIDALGARVANPIISSEEFTKANVQVAATRVLDENWRVQGSLSAQVSGDRLPTSELMTLGGARYGRAFDTGYASADSGVAGSVEVSRKLDDKPVGKGTEAYGFVDGGKLKFTDRPGLVLDDRYLSSAGGGVRLNVDDTIVGLEASRQVAGREGDGWRMAVSLGKKF